MKFLGIWLGAASALTLSACGQAKHPAAHQQLQAAAHPPAGATIASSASVSGVVRSTAHPPAGATIASSASASGVVRSTAHTPAPGAAEAAIAASAASRGGSPAGSPVTAVRSASAEGARAVAGGRDARLRSRREALAADPADEDAAPIEEASAPAGYSVAYGACISSAHGFTAATADCYTAELARAGARLNHAYAAAVAARSGDPKKRLQLAQRAWVQRRDSTCQEGVPDPAIDVLHEGSCRLDMTINRAAQLERMVG